MAPIIRRKYLKHPAIVLALVTAATLLFVLLIHALLADKIATHRHAYEIRQMQALLVNVTHDTALPPPAITLNISLADTRLRTLYPIYHQQQLTALLLHSDALAGYNAPIELLFAFQPPHTQGLQPPPQIRVLQHQETAGISDFLKQPHYPDIAAGISGATISATAITQTASALENWLALCVDWQAEVTNSPLHAPLSVACR
ncbi:MAG: FMN-binding protein [Proteobacteria bacterium]|nr:FMN-binding protein [Pseudomonadota bacterium]